MTRLHTSMPVNVNRATANETRIRVRYAETDQMGVVYHANHFIWFEVGRVELLRPFGFNYKNMEREDGCFIAVVAASSADPTRWVSSITPIMSAGVKWDGWNASVNSASTIRRWSAKTAASSPLSM